MLDAPPEILQVGIDGASWITGPRFKGIKMIPPGLHLVSYQVYWAPLARHDPSFSVSTTKHHQSGPLSSFFHHFSPQEFLVLCWNAASETFDVLDGTVAESDGVATIERLKANLYELDRFLGPFPFEGDSGYLVQEFALLANHITATLLKRVFGEERGGHFDQGTPSYHCLATTPEAFRFTRIPTSKEIVKTHPASLHDKSSVVRDLFRPLEGVLGELQLCFLIFVLGQNYEGFAQWLSIIQILSQCFDLIRLEPRFFSDLLAQLAKQLDVESALLRQIDLPELFGWDSTDGNRLKRSLQTLLEESLLQTDCEALYQSALRLSDLLQRQFDWKYDSASAEDGEDAPVAIHDVL